MNYSFILRGGPLGIVLSGALFLLFIQPLKHRKRAQYPGPTCTCTPPRGSQGATPDGKPRREETHTQVGRCIQLQCQGGRCESPTGPRRVGERELETHTVVTRNRTVRQRMCGIPTSPH